MNVQRIVWIPAIVEKIERKHRVTILEIAEILHGKKKVRKIEKGKVKGEDVYLALGQTQAGRYLAIFFIMKRDNSILPISAREMDHKEKRRYKHAK